MLVRPQTISNGFLEMSKCFLVNLFYFSSIIIIYILVNIQFLYKSFQGTQFTWDHVCFATNLTEGLFYHQNFKPQQI